MEEEKKQVNVEMDASLVAFLDELVEEDQSTRSGVIRKLIRQERARRQQLELPLPITKQTSPTRNNKKRSAQALAA